MSTAYPQKVGSLREGPKPVSDAELAAFNALLRSVDCRGTIVKIDRPGDGFAAGHCVLGFVSDEGYELSYPVEQKLFEFFFAWDSIRRM